MIRVILAASCLLLFSRLAAAGADAGAPPPHDLPPHDLPHHDLPHHDLEVRLDVEKHALTALDRIRVQGQGQVTLRLSPRFQIISFAVDGQKTPYRRDGEALLTNLGKAGEHLITVEYGGSLPPPKQPGKAAHDFPFVSPEGSYLPDSAFWLPSLDDQEFTYRLAVHVQSEAKTPNQAVAPGRLAEEKTENGVYRAVFESMAKARELVLLAGPFAVTEKTANGVRLRAYFHPPIASLADGYLDAAAAYIDRFHRQIGDYPFPSFSIVSGPLPVGLGYAGLTYMGVDVLRLPFIRQRSLGHEAAHSWFGNGIYVDYRAGNWSEGLTTFMADYAFALDEGPEKGRQMRLDWLMAYAALPPSRDRPAVSFMGKTHDASEIIGYNKVAFLFHMLKREIGEQAFSFAIRRFWDAMKFRDAAWSDLRRAFEEAAVRSLQGFFDQWLNREGAPALKLEKAETKPGEKRFRTVFSISQKDPVYIMKIPVRITTESGEEQFEVTLDSAQSSFELFTRSRPLVLAVDPDFDIFRHLDTDETPPILRDVTLKTDAIALILDEDEETAKAEQELAKRLMDAPPRFMPFTGSSLPEAPLLIIGTAAKVKALSAAAKLDLIPENLSLSANAGISASVAASRRHGKWPLLAIAARDKAAIEALLRPLPHYGRESFLLFEGSRAVKRGVLPPSAKPLTRRLSPS